MYNKLQIEIAYHELALNKTNLVAVDAEFTAICQKIEVVGCMAQ